MTKFISNFKLLFLIKILIFSLFFGNNVYAENINNNDKIIALGKNDAPVIIKVFSSHTCPHCASFHLNVLPASLCKSSNVDKIFNFSYFWKQLQL